DCFDRRVSDLCPRRRKNMIEILPPTAGADSGYSCPLMDEVSALAERERRLGEVLRGVQSRLAQREQEASRDLQMVKECAARLEQEILAARSAARDPNHISDKDYQQLVGHIREIVHHNIPAGRTVAVVSRGDGDLLEFDGRQGWHFPQTEDGTYAGHHPADSADAIEQLQALVGRGAEFLMFPATAVWWLSHFGDLRAHLEAHGERVWA